MLGLKFALAAIPKPPNDGRSQISQDVREQIRRDDDVEDIRPPDEFERGRVDENFAVFTFL